MEEELIQRAVITTGRQENTIVIGVRVYIDHLLRITAHMIKNVNI